MKKLVLNEIYKILMGRKILFILLLIIIFVGLFVYGESYMYERSLERFDAISSEKDYSWETLAKQQLKNLEDRLESPYISEERKKSTKIKISQLEYYIENDLNPITPSGAKFTEEFINRSMLLFMPLLIIILAANLVSSEFSQGTIRMLLTRPVPRWKVLLSKYLALLIMSTFVIAMIGFLSLTISGLFFSRWGFFQPVATGFQLVNGSLNTQGVVLVNRLESIILSYSLAWYVAVVIATITFMVSTIFRSISTVIGILMAALIGGQFLQFFLAEWEIIKYFFVSNLNLQNYLSGSFQAIEGMNLVFSMQVLFVWAIVSLMISFIVFINRDVLA